MLKAVVILFIGLLNLSKTTPCVLTWNQCDGVNYVGETDCCAPATCQYSNPWYSQCLPGTTDSSTTTTTTTTKTTTTTTTTQGNSGCNGVYSQCGGQNWAGSTCCTDSVCIYSNPYYSQCLPGSASSSSSSTSTTQSTSTTTTPSTTTTTTTPTTTTTTSASTTSSSSSTNQGCSSLYQQCGGIGWQGLATCCTGSSCNYLNDWYWQCLPSGQPTSSSSSSSSSSVSSSTASSSTSSSSSGNGDSQPGTTTRYWDCCKASCGWAGKAIVSNPVQTCQQNGTSPIDQNAQSVCNGGDAYMCNNQQPWAYNATHAFGYAAAHIGGQGESDWCCACYELTFISSPVTGQVLTVQVTNTGGDLNDNHFDLQIPGGGFGIYDGCTSQFPGSYQWGDRYGGIGDRSHCEDLPPVLKPGCYWRFDWFKGADNPSMNFRKVTCPSVLTANTNCVRQ